MTSFALINRCGYCSNDPKIKTDIKTVGHGSNVTEYWVECSCGIRTISIDDYAQTRERCESGVVRIWNHNR